MASRQVAEDRFTMRCPSEQWMKPLPSQATKNRMA